MAKGGENVSKITSGKTLAVIVLIDVPPGIPDGAEVAQLVPAISASLGMAAFVKVVTTRLEVMDPVKMAEMLTAPWGKPTLVKL